VSVAKKPHGDRLVNLTLFDEDFDNVVCGCREDSKSQEVTEISCSARFCYKTRCDGVCFKIILSMPNYRSLGWNIIISVPFRTIGLGRHNHIDKPGDKRDRPLSDATNNDHKPVLGPVDQSLGQWNETVSIFHAFRN
jgi:hypothetical protein